MCAACFVAVVRKLVHHVDLKNMFDSKSFRVQKTRALTLANGNMCVLGGGGVGRVSIS